MANYQIAHSRLVPEMKIQYRSPQEYQHVESCLQKINSGRNGHELIKRLRQLSVNGKYVHILTHDKDNAISCKITTEQSARFGVPDDYRDPRHHPLVLQMTRVKPNGQQSEGGVAIVKLNQNQSLFIDTDGQGVAVSPAPGLNFLSLGHELVHAYHMLNGTYQGGYPTEEVYTPNSHMRVEEDRATGAGIFAGSVLSENGIRFDHGLPLRATYFTKDTINHIG